jgi:hypothetical protein
MGYPRDGEMGKRDTHRPHPRPRPLRGARDQPPVGARRARGYGSRSKWARDESGFQPLLVMGPFMPRPLAWAGMAAHLRCLERDDDWKPRVARRDPGLIACIPPGWRKANAKTRRASPSPPAPLPSDGRGEDSHAALTLTLSRKARGPGRLADGETVAETVVEGSAVEHLGGETNGHFEGVGTVVVIGDRELLELVDKELRARRVGLHAESPRR